MPNFFTVALTGGVMTYEREQEVEVYFDGCWQAGRIFRVCERGADVLIGTRGLWYVAFDRIREAQR